jgi:hypothetical protein
MRSIQPQIIRRGHSFIELVTAMVSSAMLLAGLGAVLMISRQIAYAPTASNARLNAARAVNRLAEELRCAKWVMERSTDAIEFVVADRNADGAGERIRYEWTGNELSRAVNDGVAVPVAEDVQSFEIEYVYATTTDRLYPVSDSAETTLASNTSTQGTAVRNINNQLWVSQQVNPLGFSSIPAGATSWNATRVDFYGRRNGASNTTLLVQLRSGGAPNNGPTSEVLGATSVADTALTPASGWNSLAFSTPIRGLSLSQRYNIVWASSNLSVACVLHYVDTTPSGGVSETSGSDPGATWQYYSSRYVFYRLWGTYTTAGTPVDVTRSRLSSVNVTLQTDNASHARIESGIALENGPELVSSVWRADFEPDEPDPTAIDLDGDDNLDWAMASGSFAVNTVSGGMWTVSGAIQSRPLNNFTDVTCIDARCRLGGVLRINADRQGGTHGPLIVRVVSASGRQTLTLSGETAAATEKVLATVERLPTNWVRYRLLIVPQQNCVRLLVNDRTIGTYAYPTYNTNTAERFISISGAGAQFDFVEATVADGAVVQLAI